MFKKQNLTDCIFLPLIAHPPFRKEGYLSRFVSLIGIAMTHLLCV